MLFQVYVHGETTIHPVMADAALEIGSVLHLGGAEAIIASQIWYARAPDDRHVSGWFTAVRIIKPHSK